MSHFKGQPVECPNYPSVILAIVLNVVTVIANVISEIVRLVIA